MKKVFLTALLGIFCTATFSEAQELKPFASEDSAASVRPRTPLENVRLQDTVLPGDANFQDDSDKFQYLGSHACSGCHDAASTENKVDRVTDFVRMDEFAFWLDYDAHSLSYLRIIPNKNHYRKTADRLRRLHKLTPDANHPARSVTTPRNNIPRWEESASNQLSKIILETMNVDLGIFESVAESQIESNFFETKNIGRLNEQLQTVQMCLSCHAGWDNRQDEFDSEIIKYGTGVSCESCHGPSSHWVEEHDKPEWRQVDPREKESVFGLVDVRNPISRAEQCFSCHIGNVAQGKVVTHEMYVAGHPPLPGIEIESFADQMPRHWRYLSQKENFDFADSFKKHYGFNLKTGSSIEWNADEYPRTKNLLVGGVMASAHSVDLLANSAGEYLKLRQQAGAGGPVSFNKKSPWPEFAVFDCTACHHDLKPDGSSSQRGFAGIPGRPPAPYWPRSLTKLGAAYLDKKDGDWSTKLDAQQEKFQAVLDLQPFGKPTKLNTQGNGYSKWLRNDLANAIQVEPLNRKDAYAVLQLLVGSKEAIFSPEKETWDFHSARQLAWAINVVYGELRLSRFASELGEMRENLMLDLPDSGQITNQQPQYLSKWRDFDRQKFLQNLTSLREAFKAIDEPNLGVTDDGLNQ